jgi:anaerobic magnesium-protoporphyrin IX monomethyl ester cyclase
MPPFKEFCFDSYTPSEVPIPPLGIMYLATPLIRKGYDVKFIDFTVDELNYEQYLDAMKSADFYLITCFTEALASINRIIQDIRLINKNAYILTGGPYCIETDKHVEGSHISVFGEADLIICEIIERIILKKSLNGIPGLSYEKDGNIIRNEGTLLVNDLNEINMPSFDIVKNKNYGMFFSLKFDSVIPVSTSRGCPFKCTFCTYRQRKYRERSVKDVIDELRIRIADGAKYIVFCDDNFLVNKRRVVEMMDTIIRNKFKIKIILMGRVDLADYELFKKMKKAGVILIQMGIESINQDTLDFYNKKITVDAIMKAIETANKAGILTSGFFIIGAPNEEDKHFDAMKIFFRKSSLDFMFLNILKYVYPSILWEQAYLKGLIGKNETVVMANKKLSNYSYEELVEKQAQLIKFFYNNPVRILRIFKKSFFIFGFQIFFLLIKVFLNKSIYRTGEKLLELDDLGKKVSSQSFEIMFSTIITL